MVELLQVVVEAAHHGVVGARVRVQRDEGGGHQRHLRDAPVALGILADADDGARAQLDAGACLGGQRGGGEAQAVARDGLGVAVARVGQHLAAGHFGDDGGDQAVAVRAFLQCSIDGVVALLGVRRQVDEGFRAAVAVALVVGDDVAPRRGVGCILVGLQDRRVDADALGVAVFLVLGVDGLARQFGHVFGVRVETLLAAAVDMQRLRQRLPVLALADVIEFAHALQDQLLARVRLFRIADRVVARGILRQAGQHGHFRDRQFGQGLAEIRLRRAAEAERALAQVHLVHVQLEDLLFRQGRLDLQGQHDFIELARSDFFARQEEVARHLHGDGGAAAVAEAVAQVRQHGAAGAHEVDAVVFVEAAVLDGQQGLLHHFRHLGDGHEVAVLLAEFADQHIVGRVHAQGNLRLVIRDDVQVGQARTHVQEQVGGQQQGGGQRGAAGDDEAAHGGAAGRPGKSGSFGSQGSLT